MNKEDCKKYESEIEPDRFFKKRKKTKKKKKIERRQKNKKEENLMAKLVKI